jgi:hypothetical protein
MDGASTVWWTCLIEAVAKGIRLKFANGEYHDGPREEAITLWGTEKCQFAGGGVQKLCHNRGSLTKIGSGLEMRKVFQKFSEFSTFSRLSNRHKIRGTRISETSVHIPRVCKLNGKTRPASYCFTLLVSCHAALDTKVLNL